MVCEVLRVCVLLFLEWSIYNVFNGMLGFMPLNYILTWILLESTVFLMRFFMTCTFFRYEEKSPSNLENIGGLDFIGFSPTKPP